jgi:regulator of RNase E activity RraA
MPEILEKFSHLRVTDISDALDKLEIRGIAWGIPPVYKIARAVGPAVTVRQVPSRSSKEKVVRHGFVLEKIAQAGDIIVIDAGGRTDTATWGGILSNRAKVRGIAGLVIDGAVRDVLEIEEIKFPVFARGINAGGSAPRLETVGINVPVQIGDIQVRPGDIVVAEADGIAVIPKESAGKICEVAKRVADDMKKRNEAVKMGKSLNETL